MSSRSSSPPGEVRIIGGEWRGRKLPVVDAEGLRPTADRVRETLFNWLAPVLPGMRGLDLFAGTGALGLEALSRGAALMTFVERQPVVARQLDDSLQRLNCANAEVVLGDALGFLSGTPRHFDLVFLDPPFGTVDLGDLCRLLDRGWLADKARVYLELARAGALPALPAGWTVLREKTAGEVRYALAAVERAS